MPVGMQDSNALAANEGSSSNAGAGDAGKLRMLYITVQKDYGKRTKLCLEKLGLYDKKRRVLTKQEDGSTELLLPVVDRVRVMFGQRCTLLDSLAEIGCSLELVDVPEEDSAVSKKHASPFERLRCLVKGYFDGKTDPCTQDSLLAELPTRWERHGDIVLFPSSAFVSSIWHEQDPSFWSSIADIFKASRVGLMGPVYSNSYRTPCVRMLLGDSGWTQHIDNGVTYCFDVTKCMFSSGNVTEKLRIAGFSCAGETVVDLFAGIGYFTLPYLVRAGAARVHACEWNPDAVEALRRGLLANDVPAERCIIHEGDNAEVCPIGVADRVNLGLLPSSREAWPVACRALKSSGGVLHVHHNVDAPPATAAEDERSHWLRWAESAASAVREILVATRGPDWDVHNLGIHRVKSYAPHVTHLVVDLDCRPSREAPS